MATRYDEQNCNSSHLACNLEDDRELYKSFLDAKYGTGTAESLKLKSKLTVKFSERELKEMIAFYKLKVKALRKTVDCSKLY